MCIRGELVTDASYYQQTIYKGVIGTTAQSAIMLCYHLWMLHLSAVDGTVSAGPNRVSKPSMGFE